MHTFAWHSTCVDAGPRRQLVEVGSFCLPRVVQALNLGHQPWQQASLSTEPSLQPYTRRSCMLQHTCLECQRVVFREGTRISVHSEWWRYAWLSKQWKTCPPNSGRRVVESCQGLPSKGIVKAGVPTVLYMHTGRKQWIYHGSYDLICARGKQDCMQWGIHRDQYLKSGPCGSIRASLGS